MWTQFLWNYLKQQSTLGLPLTEFLFWNLVFMIWTNKYFLCLYLSQDRWKIFFSSVVKMKSFDVRSTDLTFFISSLHIRCVYLQLLLIQSKISFCCGKVEVKWWFQSVWSDLAIFCTLGKHSKLAATIILPKSPTLLGNFCKGVKIIHFSSELNFGQLL